MENTKKLISKIERIKKMGWIKGVNNASSGIGLTLESLLGKEYDSFQIPDYDDIEIKSKTIGSRSDITLFNCTPDSYIFEIKRIKETYGYPDKRDPALKVFNITACTNRFTRISYTNKVNLKVNYSQRVVTFQVFNSKGNLIDDDTSWSFDLLKEIIFRKLKYLLLVKAKKKYIDGNAHFKYTEATLYKLKSFEHFLNAIQNGDIVINFSIGVIRSGPKYGNIHDHGTGFNISENNLEKIFDKVN